MSDHFSPEVHVMSVNRPYIINIMWLTSFRREFEETIDTLQNDIDTLEKEKVDMKKR